MWQSEGSRQVHQISTVIPVKWRERICWALSPLLIHSSAPFLLHKKQCSLFGTILGTLFTSLTPTHQSPWSPTLFQSHTLPPNRLTSCHASGTMAVRSHWQITGCCCISPRQRQAATGVNSRQTTPSSQQFNGRWAVGETDAVIWAPHHHRNEWSSDGYSGDGGGDRNGVRGGRMDRWEDWKGEKEEEIL